jgi:hypothetical protein
MLEIQTCGAAKNPKVSTKPPYSMYKTMEYDVIIFTLNLD